MLPILKITVPSSSGSRSSTTVDRVTLNALPTVHERQVFSNAAVSTCHLALQTPDFGQAGTTLHEEGLGVRW
jgi:hypothetical protein